MDGGDLTAGQFSEGRRPVVGSGSSSSASRRLTPQASTEERGNMMPTKAEIRRQYERRLSEHPAVKALARRKLPERAEVPVRPGVPRLIAEAMEDANVGTAVTSIRQVMKYDRRVGDVVRRQARGEAIPLNEQLALVRQGANIEHVFREGARAAFAAARSDPGTGAYAAAMASRPDDTSVLDDLPSFVSRQEWSVIRYLGMTEEQVRDVWSRFYTPRRQEVMNLMASGNLRQEMERLERSAAGWEFPDAPRYLVKRDIITLGGDEPGVETVICVALITVAVCFCTYVICDCIKCVAAANA